MKRGRKRIEIDWNKVDSMISVMESGQAIAQTLGISDETLYTAVRREKGLNFTDYARKLKAISAFRLKAQQFREAFGYDIWLTEEVTVINPKTGEKVALRKRKQTKRPPSIPMLIYLGKLYLGQSDSKDNRNDGETPGWDIVGDEEDPN
ncbi:hypothetical protein ACFPMF_11210 [Larkinella bovis]|uniref:XRE family transcriptional regulator n=1 Tax=Larkinella bovis TaxID=683041 RepID=A0ABW0IAG1_9BACT